MAKKSNKKSEKREILIFDDQDTMIRAFVDCWIARARKALIAAGNFTAALSGGKTPEPFYRALAKAVTPTIWQNSHLFMVDERHVPFDHPDSNWGMIRREMIQDIPIFEGNLHPVPIAETPETSAEKYEKELRRFFGRYIQFPSIDLMVLGIGEDGHVASLFPGDPALQENVRWCAAVEHRGVSHARISLTLPVIQNSREVLYMIRGEEKAKRVKEILKDRNSKLPATKAESRDGKTIYLLDRAAASLL
jgi:6-phosphogluconolactonase